MGGIYIKKYDEDFSLNNAFVNEGENIFSILLTEKGDYTFGYSIDGDDNKNIYEINDLKVKVANHIFDVLIFIPPNPFILKEIAKKELQLDIIFYFGYNFEITLNLYKEEDENNKITFNHSTGTSLYELSDEDINNLESDTNYYFTITQTSIGSILYKQKIIFSDIKIEPFYYLNDYIVISNIKKKIDFLTITNEGNEEYKLDNQKLFKDKNLLYIYIPKTIGKKYGNYEMRVDRDPFASFFFSKSILDADFIVSNMTNNHLVTISSINYYVPNIETIEVTSSTQDIKIYNSDDFEIIDNTLVLQLKEIDNEKTYRITKITEKCNLSDKEKCSQLQLLPIGKNEDYGLEVDTFYTISLDDDDDNNNGNNVNNKKETEIDISFKFRKSFCLYN